MNIQPHQYQILVVEDDPSLRELLEHNLRFEGYQVSVCEDAILAEEKLENKPPDLMILDLMLPHKSGLELCRQLRQQDNELPIIMLTAKSSSADIVRGLNSGADDYLGKPFELMELLARVESLLRRTQKSISSDTIVRLGDITIDFNQQCLIKDGKQQALTAQENSLLEFLFQHSGEVMSREQIMQAVWKHEELFSYRTIDTHITRLRQKIEVEPSKPKHILTAHRVGYRLEL